MSKPIEKVNKKKPVKQDDPTFPLHKLREHSQEQFGVKPEVLDGAFFHVKKAQISKAEAKGHIESFLNKEVKQ